MYCDKSNVNILTAYMAAYGIRHVVVCPGSRNAVLVHNFAVCDAFTCHAVTDERSAAFVALGMAASLSAPVAVCVTSGTALLNTLPAIAEAHYRQLPLLIILPIARSNGSDSKMDRPYPNLTPSLLTPRTVRKCTNSRTKHREYGYAACSTKRSWLCLTDRST